MTPRLDAIEAGLDAFEASLCAIDAVAIVGLMATYLCAGILIGIVCGMSIR